MIKLLLNLFDGGGDGAATASGSSEGVTAVSPAATESVDGQSSPDNEVVDRKANYDKFKADYKAEYDAEVQSIVKDRLKKSNARTNELNEKLKRVAPLLEHMANKYGVDVNDADALLNAFQDDDANYEDEAFEKGMTVDQVKTLHKLERENASLREAENERARQAQFAEWDRQAEELKAIYPSFDIGVEMESPEFCKLMNAGVPIRTAYEVAHREEIMQGAMQFTAQKTAEKITNAVIANKARPSENGISSQAATVTKQNIRSFDRAKMDELKRRAMAGEKIDLK